MGGGADLEDEAMEVDLYTCAAVEVYRSER